MIDTRPEYLPEEIEGPDDTESLEGILGKELADLLPPSPSPSARAASSIAAIGESVEARFFTATTGSPASPKQRIDVAQLREFTVALAIAIERRVPAGRNKALALTALEDVLMRANRAIFAPEGHK
ncbi:hypothetical protein [Frigoribacterium sp. UYMn621]|uniref:Acb2/Tad1 domain-containing protein n=1 Tax=Frigoribacterium sp. UYMn621 TaxID=3156343 RepID=UPI003397D63B